MRRVRSRLRVVTLVVTVLGGMLALGVAAANRSGPLPPKRLVMTGREDGASHRPPGPNADERTVTTRGSALPGPQAGRSE